MIKQTLGVLAILTAWCALFVAGGSASGQSTTFQYQGRLNDMGSPATGSYDLAFSIYDASTNGDQIGPAVTRNGTTVLSVQGPPILSLITNYDYFPASGFSYGLPPPSHLVAQP